MSRCAVLGARGLTAFSGIIAASLARCAYVPLNPAHPQSRLAAILDAADIDAMIVDHDALACARDLIPNLPRGATILLPNCPSPPDWATGMRHIFLSQADLQPRDLDPFEPGNPDDGAYLLHTSGSTGTPKGIQVRNRNVMAYLRSDRRTLRAQPNGSHVATIRPDIRSVRARHVPVLGRRRDAVLPASPRKVRAARLRAAA